MQGVVTAETVRDVATLEEASINSSLSAYLAHTMSGKH